jgi:MFS family permease
MNIMKIFIACIFFVPMLIVLAILMGLFGVVGSFTYELALHTTGSAATACLASGLMGVAVVALIRYGFFRRLPFKRLTLKDIYGWYISFFVGFLISPYLATVAMGYFGHLTGEAWHTVITYVLSGFLPVGLAFALDKLNICKLPSLDTDKKNDPWDRK